MKYGVHGGPQTPPVRVQDLTQVNLRESNEQVWTRDTVTCLRDERVAQQQSGQDEARGEVASGQEAEAEEEDHGVYQERFPPADGVTEGPGKAGRHEVTEDPTAGCNRDD